MRRLLALFLACVPSILVSVVACGSDSDDPADGTKNTSSSSGSTSFNNDGGGSGRDGSADGCAPSLRGLVRDFRGSDVDGGHPDFQTFGGSTATTGLVQPTLGPDKKPVFASTTGSGQDGQQITSAATFDQWFRDTPGVNQTFPFDLPLVPIGNGVLSYTNGFFFPIDGQGFGISGNDVNDAGHNFHFTLEIHLEFVYRGGEVFTFTGDDDLWAFMNNRLALDIGGLHPAVAGSVDLDARAAELGLEKGKTYPLDVFQAERRTNASTFRIDTTLEFVNCDPILVPK